MDETRILKKKYDRNYYLKNREAICEKRRKYYKEIRIEYIKQNNTNYGEKVSKVPITVAVGILIKFD